jgi:hypothetical protein
MKQRSAKFQREMAPAHLCIGALIYSLYTYIISHVWIQMFFNLSGIICKVIRQCSYLFHIVDI